MSSPEYTYNDVFNDIIKQNKRKKTKERQAKYRRKKKAELENHEYL